MSVSRKYGRSFHFPFSPGTTSDDRIHSKYWEDFSKINTVVHTEKLDGENTCLNKHGVFARSHAAPTRHPWAKFLKEKWHLIKNDLGQLEIFGENIYAIHSIEYQKIETHFYVFAIRENEQWLSWEETKFYSKVLDFHIVPELIIQKVDQQKEFESQILEVTKAQSTFGSVDVQTGEICKMEGVVSRNISGYSEDERMANLLKYVRKDHVKTDEHWSRKWKRAALKWEK